MSKTNSIFITGANGFIGSSFVEYCAAQGVSVMALIRSGLPHFIVDKNVKVVFGDILDRDSISKCIKPGMIVVHLAANPYHPVLSHKVNVEGTRNLVEVCRIKKVERVVYVSSQAVKITNKGVYAKTKLEGEQIIIDSGLPYTIVRPSLVYGEGELGLFNKIRKLAKMLPFIPVFGDGQAKVCPIHIEDLCRCLMDIALDKNCEGGIFDLGSRENITYDQFYERLITYLGLGSVKVIHIPVWIGLLASKFFLILKMKNPPFYPDNILGSTQDTNCDVSLYVNKFGFTPRNFGVNTKLKVLIVGLGKIGLLHLSILKSFSNVEIAGIVDTNKVSLGTVRTLGLVVPVYSDLDLALSSKNYDACYVFTPTAYHYEIARKVISKYINVFIEKPVCISVEQTKELRDLAIKYNVVAYTGYTMLYNRCFLKAKEIILSGKYGKIKNFEMTYFHSEVIGKPKSGWMFKKDISGGGVLMNPGPHFFSIIYLFFGIPTKVNSILNKKYSVEVEDEANIDLYYPDFSGKVYASWSEPGHDISSLECKIFYDNYTINVNKSRVVVLENKTKKKSITMFEDLESSVQNIFNINPDAYGEEYYLEHLAFLNLIIGVKPKLLLSPISEATNIEKIISMCYKNSRNEK